MSSSTSRAGEGKSQNLGGRNAVAEGLRCASQPPSPLGTRQVSVAVKSPLQLLSRMKPPQQMREFYKPGKRHEVLQAVLNPGKVTWKLHSWLWGEAMRVWTPAPGEGCVLSADTARCCGEHRLQLPWSREQVLLHQAAETFSTPSLLSYPSNIGGFVKEQVNGSYEPLSTAQGVCGEDQTQLSGQWSCARYYDAEGR